MHGSNMNPASLHLFDGFEKFSREVALRFIGIQFSVGQGLILRGHGEPISSRGASQYKLLWIEFRMEVLS